MKKEVAMILMMMMKMRMKMVGMEMMRTRTWMMIMMMRMTGVMQMILLGSAGIGGGSTRIPTAAHAWNNVVNGSAEKAPAVVWLDENSNS